MPNDGFLLSEIKRVAEITINSWQIKIVAEIKKQLLKSQYLLAEITMIMIIFIQKRDRRYRKIIKNKKNHNGYWNQNCCWNNNSCLNNNKCWNFNSWWNLNNCWH